MVLLYSRTIGGYAGAKQTLELKPSHALRVPENPGIGRSRPARVPPLLSSQEVSGGDTFVYIPRLVEFHENAVSDRNRTRGWRMRFSISKGMHNVELTFGSTTPRRLASTLSLIGLFGAIAVSCALYRRSRFEVLS